MMSTVILRKKLLKRITNIKKILALNRPEIALELGIENVHLTMQRTNGTGKTVFYKKRVGVSVHSAEEAETAQKLGADYLIAGHIYATDCKKVFLPEELNFSGVYVKVLIFLFLR